MIPRKRKITEIIPDSSRRDSAGGLHEATWSHHEQAGSCTSGPVTRVAEIAHERSSITAGTAIRLGRYFKTTPRLWLNLQTTYDPEGAEDRVLPEVNNQVQPPS